MKIFRKIKLKIKVFSEKILIKLILFSRSPKFTAFLISLTIKDVNQKGEYKILCLRRSIFMDDVKAMTIFSGRLHYLAVSRNIFQLPFLYFLGIKGDNKLQFHDYYSNSQYQGGLKKYYEFLKKMIPELQKRVGFDAVLSGNYVYPEQQEIARVCKEENIPLIVLYKESLTLGVQEEDVKVHKDSKFIGDKIMVYNDNVINRLLALDDLNVQSKDLCVIVGSPRLDYGYSEDYSADPQKQIVFFSFIPKAKFISIVEDPKLLEEAIQRSINFHKWVIQYAQEHPDIKVIIKTKVAKYYLEYPRKILEKYFKQSIPNLEITSAGNSTEMIRKSKVIIAFRSTTQIESIIIDQPVISPYFGDLVPNQKWDFFGEYPGLIKYVNSYQELEDSITNSDQLRKRDPEIKNAFLKKHIGFVDGKSSQRAEEEMIKVILNKSKSK